MSAKVGIPAGIFNFPAPAGIFNFPAEKNFPWDFQKLPWENIPLDWKGNKFHGKNSVD